MRKGLFQSVLIASALFTVVSSGRSNGADFVVTVRDLKTNAQQEAPVTVRVVDTESGVELVATRPVKTTGDTIRVTNADFKNLQRISLRFEFRSPTGDLEPATLDRVMNVPLPTGGGTFASQTLIVVMPEAKVNPSLPPSEYCPVPCECYPVHRRCGLFRR